MDGNVVGNAVDVTFGGAQMPANQTYPVAGAQYIAIDYLLVNQRKLIDVSLGINHINSAIPDLVIPFKNIAVERNYQTNLTIKSLNN